MNTYCNYYDTDDTDECNYYKTDEVTDDTDEINWV